MENNTITLSIKPLDTLFFRNGRPFDMGDDTWAEGMFPPPLSVIYGALRTFLLTKTPELYDDIKLAAKNRTNLPDEHLLNKFSINKVALFITDKNKGEGAVYYPNPLELAEQKEEIAGKVFAENETTDNTIISSLDIPLNMFRTKKEVKEAKGAYLSAGNFEKYLSSAHNVDFLPYLSQESFTKNEAKIGIKKDRKTHSSEEHALYRVGMKRIGSEAHEVGFMIEVENYPVEVRKDEIIKLGGEGKQAVLNVADETYWDLPNIEYNTKSKQFRLVILSPTYFENGMYPAWLKNENNKITGTIPNSEVEIELKSAFIGKAINIGGWDMLKREPKPMMKYVPAGSVFHFNILNADFETMFEAFETIKLSENNTHKPGFGYFEIGNL